MSSLSRFLIVAQGVKELLLNLLSLLLLREPQRKKYLASVV